MSRFLGIDLGTQSLKAIVYDRESREIAAAPGADGVVVLPFYNGERTPNLPNGKGCILGLNDTNMTPANIVRASMESAIFGLRAGLEAFARAHKTLVDRIDEIRLTGGAARSAIWRQIVADNFGRPVRLPASQEGAAMGAAFERGELGLQALRDIAAANGEPASISGRQEWLENLVNQYI